MRFTSLQIKVKSSIIKAGAPSCSSIYIYHTSRESSLLLTILFNVISIQKNNKKHHGFGEPKENMFSNVSIFCTPFFFIQYRIRLYLSDWIQLFKFISLSKYSVPTTLEQVTFRIILKGIFCTTPMLRSSKAWHFKWKDIFVSFFYFKTAT